MKRSGYFTFLFVFGFSLSALCQQAAPVLQNIVAKLKTLSNEHIIERAYLNFDKPYYMAGDTMYFKACVMIGEYHALSTKASNILNVDLINPENVIIRNIKLQLNNGVSAGDFSLPDTLEGGAYRVRAYTRYMLNAPEYFFDKTILVSSRTGNNANSTGTKQTDKPDIQFFPEGGDMVTSVISKVAVKAIGVNGLGIKAKGVVVDNNNVQVATFNTNDLGMGVFFIQPEQGKSYKAKVAFARGAQAIASLPAPVAKGIMLQARDTLGKISIEIVCNKEYLQDNMNKDVNLVMYCNGTVSKVSTKLDSREMGLDVAKAQFPSGVMRITLFSQDGEPLSERLVFLKNEDVVNIAVNSDKSAYRTRERVQLNIHAKSKGAGAVGYFSAAVTDESRVPADDNNETTILSYLLLTSELKGYIEKPNYYFANNTPEAHRDLDALMLTQGYRRFAWKQLLSDDTSKFTYTPEKALVISGTESTSAKAAVVNKDVLLFAVANKGMMSEKTDKAGKFTFCNLNFEDGTEFMLQATGSNKDKNSTVISLAKDAEPLVSDNSEMSGNENQLMAPFAEKQHGGIANVSIPVGQADQQIDGSDLGSAASLTEALNGRLNGVNFVSGVPYLKENKYPMLIVVDGKIRGSYVKLDNITPVNVQSVQLLKGKNADYYGSSGSSGVLVITTRYGSNSTDLSSQTSEYKYQSQNVVKAKGVYVSEANNTNYRSSNLAGPGHADQVVHSEAFENAPSLSTGLNGLLRRVDFVNGVPYLRGNVVLKQGMATTEPMYVIIDGVPNSESIDMLNPHSVETVEMLSGANAGIYGTNGGPGVLVITTRMQSAPVVNTTSSIGSLRFRPKGLYRAREFYSPKYTSTSGSSAPDVRSTIYWNPNIVTDKDGNGSCEYYNSDGKGSYRVIIEGVDEKGNPGWQVYRYKVE